MTIYIGADHRGFEIKNQIIEWMKSMGHQAEDCGPHELTPMDDYVDFAKAVSEKVTQSPGNRGIVICGSGAGVNIASNKIKGIRCSIGFNLEQVKAARRDDDLNVLAIASNYTLFEDVKVLIETFLNTPYDPTDNHARRIEKIKKLEASQ